MSICEPCTTANEVPVCTENLTLGTIPLTDTAVYIYFRDVKNGRFERTTATTDGAGTVIADLTQISAMSRHIYEVWVTAATGGVDDKETITIGAVTTDCFNIEFERITGEVNYTLTL